MNDLEELYKQHKNGMFSIAYSVTRERQSAEDVVHEVFLKLSRIDRDGLNLVSYTYAMIRNKALDHIRRKKTIYEKQEFIFDLDHLLPHRETLADEALSNKQLKVCLAQALEEIPEDQKEIIILRQISHLSFQQISDMKNLPISTLSSRYQTGLKNLKNILEQHYGITA